MFKFAVAIGLSLLCVASSFGPEDVETAIMTGIGTAKEMIDRGMAMKSSRQYGIALGPAAISTKHDTAIGFGDAMQDKESDSSEERRRRSISEDEISNEKLISDSTDLKDNERLSVDRKSRVKRAPCFFKWYNTMTTAPTGGGEVESLRSEKLKQAKQRNFRFRREAEKEMRIENFGDPNAEVIPSIEEGLKQHMNHFVKQIRDTWDKTLDTMKGMLDNFKSSFSSTIQKEMENAEKN